MQLQGLSSPKSIGQASKLEIPARIDIAILSLEAGDSDRISKFQNGNRILSSMEIPFLASLFLRISTDCRGPLSCLAETLL